MDGFEEHEHEADGEEVVDRDRDHTTARLSFTQLREVSSNIKTTLSASTSTSRFPASNDDHVALFYHHDRNLFVFQFTLCVHGGQHADVRRQK